MIFPTMSVLTYGAILVAVLLAADWYVWGLTYASDFRRPHLVKPQGSGDRVEGEPATITTTGTSAQDDGHGFKQVA